MSAETSQMSPEYVQGSVEWHALRKTKITATDAAVIMGVNHWKTIHQLYDEKLSNDPPKPPNAAMKRGIDLEPVARDLFNTKTRLIMTPQVIIKDWMMASLDGMSDCGNYIVEIKCPGERDHSIALSGKVPEHYYPQLQHQIHVCNVHMAYYFSFDGVKGVIVEVMRDQKYIDRMVEEERKFYECIMNKTPPKPIESDYIERNDDLWKKCAYKWKTITETIKSLEKEEEEVRQQLVFLSGESNTKGAGISLCQVERKGAVDYSRIPQLKGMDLELYRKPGSQCWRISNG